MSWLWLALAMAAPPTGLFERNCERYAAKLGWDSPLIGACYYQVGVQSGQLDAAREHLERLRVRYPQVGGYALALANTRKALQVTDESVGGLLEEAVTRFTAEGEQQGLVFALSSLVDWHLGNLDGDGAVAAAARLREASTTPLADRVARSVQARVLLETGQDVAEAVRLWEELLVEPRPVGESYIAHGRVVSGLARAYLMLGRASQARARAEDARVWYRAHRDRFSLAQSTALELAALIDELDADGSVPGEDGLADRAHELVAQAEEAANKGVLATALLHVARFDLGARDEALSRCVHLSSWEQSFMRELRCHLELARDGRDEGLLDRLEAHPVVRGSYGFQTEIAGVRLELARAAGDEGDRRLAEQQLVTALRRLDVSEPEVYTRLRLREMGSSLVRTAVGWRLADGQVAEALALSESTRARVPQQRSLPARLVEVHAQLTRIQRALREGTGETSELLAQLEVLEREEARLATPAAPLVDGGSDALLARVQGALRPDQALLVFSLDRDVHVDGRPGGGCWLMVVRPDGATAHALGDARDLRGRLELTSDLVAAGIEAKGPLRQLHASLLDEGLAGLSAGVGELLVVADGPLHVTPLEALRSASGVALGLQHRVVRLAGVQRWLEAPAVDLSHSVALAMVDPPATRAGAALLRSAVLAEVATLGALPATRREAEALQEALGDGRVEVLAGRQASERALSERLTSVGWVHFGAHALVDPWVPERSALLLAPSDAEDGLLQVREIRTQDWTGKAIVLAACRTADGERLDGIGPLGLAQSLSDAGAAAVVASLWPVSDQRSEHFFASLYAALGRGASLADAMRQAREERFRAGDGPHGWAAFVLLGDGSLRLTAPGGGAVPWWAWGLGVLGLGLGALGWRFRR